MTSTLATEKTRGKSMRTLTLDGHKLPKYGTEVDYYNTDSGKIIVDGEVTAYYKSDKGVITGTTIDGITFVSGTVSEIVIAIYFYKLGKNESGKLSDKLDISIRALRRGIYNELESKFEQTMMELDLLLKTRDLMEEEMHRLNGVIVDLAEENKSYERELVRKQGAI